MKIDPDSEYGYIAYWKKAFNELVYNGLWKTRVEVSILKRVDWNQLETPGNLHIFVEVSILKRVDWNFNQASNSLIFKQLKWVS